MTNLSHQTQLDVLKEHSAIFSICFYNFKMSRQLHLDIAVFACLRLRSSWLSILGNPTECRLALWDWGWSLIRRSFVKDPEPNCIWSPPQGFFGKYHALFWFHGCFVNSQRNPGICESIQLVQMCRFRIDCRIRGVVHSLSRSLESFLSFEFATVVLYKLVSKLWADASKTQTFYYADPKTIW